MQINKLPLLFLTMACGPDYEIKGIKPDVDPGDVTDCAFTPISGSQMSSYDCNPVFTNTGESWGRDVGSVGFHVTEVLGHPFYQMWYTSSATNSFGGVSMGYAVSSNGTDWTPHPSNPLMSSDPTGWDKDSIGSQVVLWDHIDQQYILAYQGITLAGIWGLGIATSPDGVAWSKSPQNPVIDFTTYSLGEQDLWNYFCSEFVSDSYICDIYGLSYSAFQPQHNVSPCWPLSITISERGSLRGYIAGSDAREAIQGVYNWAKLEQDLWDAMYTGAEVYLESGSNPASCQVYSMDGADANTWFLSEAAPVLPSGNSYDKKGVVAASVVEYTDPETEQTTHYMFYAGFEEWLMFESYNSSYKSSFNVATSTDGGVTWTKDPNNPIPINRTNPGEISSVGAQVVGSRILLWVTDNYDGESAVGYYYYEPGIPAHP